MKVIKPPQILQKEANNRYLFLAGSIEMGAAEDWQANVANLLKDTDWVVLNPRRDNWDSSWAQSINNPQFKGQVDWELDGQELSDKILMYFDPATKAPITLLELGLFAKTGKLIVVCPDGFWRKGNVEIVCDRYKIPLCDDLDKALKENFLSA